MIFLKGKGKKKGGRGKDAPNYYFWVFWGMGAGVSGESVAEGRRDGIQYEERVERGEGWDEEEEEEEGVGIRIQDNHKFIAVNE